MYVYNITIYIVNYPSHSLPPLSSLHPLYHLLAVPCFPLNSSFCSHAVCTPVTLEVICVSFTFTSHHRVMSMSKVSVFHFFSIWNHCRAANLLLKCCFVYGSLSIYLYIGCFEVSEGHKWFVFCGFQIVFMHQNGEAMVLAESLIPF